MRDSVQSPAVKATKSGDTQTTTAATFFYASANSTHSIIPHIASVKHKVALHRDDVLDKYNELFILHCGSLAVGQNQ